jgi:ABC-type sugar transport system ATPase subunit
VSLLSVAGLAKAYGGVVALRDASLVVEAGEVHALMGENGAGKSTLIKILAGAVRPEAGRIAIDGAPVSIASARDAFRHGLRFLHQELNVLSRQSVAENIFLGRAYPIRWGGFVDWRALKARARAALSALGVDDIAPDATLGQLPVGDRMIVKIAATFLDDGAPPGRVFVMDEPTASLTAREAERLFRIIAELQRRGCGIVYVSHRIEEVLRISTRITVLRDGATQAPIPSAAATRALLIERMTGRTGLDRAEATPATSRAGIALNVERLRGLGLEGVSFAVKNGEIFGLAGLGDAGGDRVLGALMGEAHSGAVLVDGKEYSASSLAAAWRAGFAYLPRERRSQGLLLSHDVARNVALPHLRRLARASVFANRSGEEREAAALGRKVRLKATGPRQRVWRLSGGNQQKVMFARAIANSPRVLLLDEPTRGVDVAARFDIHALLREIAESGAAILVASSDHEELIALCSRIAILIDGRLTRIVPSAGLTPSRLLELCYGEAE